MQIAPRLKEFIRTNFGSRLDPLVKEGLRAIARKENKSMSWVVEEVLIDYFSLRHHRYLNRKKR
jgi:predicted transcriptional regulator